MTRSYGQACLAARALDVVGERWTLLIIRELAMGPRRFSELAGGLAGIGTNLLSARLKHLNEHGVLIRTVMGGPGRNHVYELTERGRALLPLLGGLALWAVDLPPPPKGVTDRTEWALFAMHARAGPAGAMFGTMIELRIDGDTFWFYGDGASADFHHGHAPVKPGLRLTCTRTMLHRLAGHIVSVPEALAAHQLSVDGDPALAEAFFATFTIPAEALPAVARRRTTARARR